MIFLYGKYKKQDKRREMIFLWALLKTFLKNKIMLNKLWSSLVGSCHQYFLLKSIRSVEQFYVTASFCLSKWRHLHINILCFWVELLPVITRVSIFIFIFSSNLWFVLIRPFGMQSKILERQRMRAVWMKKGIFC